MMCWFGMLQVLNLTLMATAAPAFEEIGTNMVSKNIWVTNSDMQLSLEHITILVLHDGKTANAF